VALFTAPKIIKTFQIEGLLIFRLA